MRVLPRFSEDRVLREQVALIYSNYYVGFLGFFAVTILCTGVIWYETGAIPVLFWLAAM